MKIDPTKLYAVISGDFIGFSNLPVKDRQAMYFILKTAGKELAETFPGLVPCEVDMFRGDGWQVLLTKPVLSLRSALFMRAYIRLETHQKRIATRMATSIGTIDYVPEKRVSAGDGEAFRISGKLLDKMGRSKTGCIKFTMKDKKKSLTIDKIVCQADGMASQWTSKQAMAVVGGLKGWTQKQISEKWPEKISEKAIDNLLRRSRWPKILESLTAFEEKISMLI